MSHHCYRCGLPAFVGAYGYVGPVCKCFDPLRTPQYAPLPADRQGQAAPVTPLTEADVRRIIREEIERSKAHVQTNGIGALSSCGCCVFTDAATLKKTVVTCKAHQLSNAQDPHRKRAGGPLPGP